MFRHSLVAAVLAGGMALAGPVFAQDIDTRPLVDDVIEPFTANAGQIIAQTFLVPAGRTTLESFSFDMRSLESVTAFRALVMEWDPVAQAGTGTVLYDSGPVNGTDAAQEEFVFSPAGGLPVEAGKTYVAMAEWVSGPGTENAQLGIAPGAAYADGQLYYMVGARIFPGDQDLSTAFRWQTAPNDLGTHIVFDAASPPAEPVPTLAEWAMIGLTLTLASAGAVLVTRRRRLA